MTRLKRANLVSIGTHPITETDIGYRAPISPLLKIGARGNGTIHGGGHAADYLSLHWTELSIVSGSQGHSLEQAWLQEGVAVRQFVYRIAETIVLSLFCWQNVHVCETQTVCTQAKYGV